MSFERRKAHRAPRPTPDDLLSEAFEQARLAYEFASGSYAFSTLAAIASAIEHMRAPDWIEEFLAYEKLGTGVCCRSPKRASPGCAKRRLSEIETKPGRLEAVPRIAPQKLLFQQRASNRFQRTAGPANTRT